MIDSVIFDMDGVLVDSEPVYSEIIGDIYKLIGAEVPEEVHLSSYGLDSVVWWEKIIGDYNIQGRTAEELVKIERKNIKEFFKTPRARELVFDGLVPVLSSLKERGIKLAVASSNERSIVQDVLKLIGIDKYFDAVVSGTDEEVLEGKPAPDIFLHAADILGSKPENCLVVEDSQMGLRAAKAAGMSAYAFLSAPVGIDTIEADFSFSKYDQFFENIENIL